jgi:hypothetical protein
MKTREVTHVRRNDDGDITALCNPGEAWSPREKEDAIADIEMGNHDYYVVVKGNKVPIDVVHRPMAAKDKGFYLRTVKDGEMPHNLDELPEALEAPATFR